MEDFECVVEKESVDAGARPRPPQIGMLDTATWAREGTVLGTIEDMRQPASWRALPYPRRALLLYGAEPRSRVEASAARDYVAQMQAPAARAQHAMVAIAAFLTALLVGLWTGGVRAGVTLGVAVLIGSLVVVGLVHLVAIPSLQRRAARDRH